MDLERRVELLEAREEIRSILDRANALLDGGSSDFSFLQQHMAPGYTMRTVGTEGLLGDVLSAQERAKGSDGETWMIKQVEDQHDGFWHFLGSPHIEVDLEANTASAHTYVLEILQPVGQDQPDMFAGWFDTKWSRRDARWLQTEGQMTVVAYSKAAQGWTWVKRSAC